MHWSKAHGVPWLITIIFIEVMLFVLVGTAQQYAPSILAARFVPYELALALPLLSAAALGWSLRRVPHDLLVLTTRPLPVLELLLTGGVIALKVVLLGLLATVGVSGPGTAYLSNTVIFTALTCAPRVLGRHDLWLPVATFYLVIFFGVTVDGPLPWALTAQTTVSDAHLVANAMSGVAVVAALIRGYPPYRSRE